MADITLNAKFLIRNDTAANWSLANPILGKGEMGVESDTKRFKFGDGAGAWSTLDYAVLSVDTDAVPEGSSNLYYTEVRASTNFDTNFAKKKVSELADATNYVSIDDVIVFDGGNANGSVKA